MLNENQEETSIDLKRKKKTHYGLVFRLFLWIIMP